MISPRDKLDRARSARRRAEKPDEFEARGRRGLEPMTVQVKKSWQLAELHGLWWAYEGDMPPPEAFQTHGRPPHVPILGPYPSRTIAESLLRRHLALLWHISACWRAVLDSQISFSMIHRRSALGGRPWLRQRWIG